MKSGTLNVGVVALALSGAAACGLEPVGPSTFDSDSLHVVAKVQPTLIAAGDSATVVTIFHNETERRLTVNLGGCPFYLEVIDRRSGDQVQLGGSSYACVAVGTSREIAPGDSLVLTKSIVAKIGDMPAPRGEYAARVDFTAGVPDLEAPFTVK